MHFLPVKKKIVRKSDDLNLCCDFNPPAFLTI